MVGSLIQKNKRLSTAIVLASMAVCTIWMGLNRRGDRLYTYMHSDAQWYYSYLPAWFIYDGFENHPRNLEHHMFNTYEDTEIVFTKYTCGVAFLQAPFFLTAHALAKAGVDEPTGYSPIYGFFVLLAAVFYMLAGMLLLLSVLRRHFSLPASLLTLFAVFFGTNLLHYTYSEPGMSHVYSFFLFSAFIWLTPRFVERPNWKNGLGLAATLSIIILIRPTNAVIALYLLGFQVYSLKELGNRIVFVLQQWKLLLIGAVAGLIIVYPQLAYWHQLSGDWILYSYGDEGFIYALAPKVWSVLTSHQNGFLIYAPVMLLALYGMVRSTVKRQLSGPVQLLIFAIATYTFGSWWAWWFGGAFGHRCYVEFLAFLSIPLAATAEQLLTSRIKAVPVATAAFVLLCCYYTTSLTVYYSPPWDGPDWTWQRFWDVGISRLF